MDAVGAEDEIEALRRRNLERDVNMVRMLDQPLDAVAEKIADIGAAVLVEDPREIGAPDFEVAAGEFGGEANIAMIEAGVPSRPGGWMPIMRPGTL